MDVLAAQKIGNRVTWFSIFTSASTLVCCALPALLVALGAGAALATVIGVVPQLVWISEHKTGVFALAGAMLAVAGYFQCRARFSPCPADPLLATACVRQRRVSQIIYGVSVVIYVVGGFFAFVAPYFL
jgi:sorbitol-specific phosphotransferase system component IIBC